ncbi:MAG: TonB-dependent receptor [Calditrichaeota bacterium]|nr:TonB-dependent receptor [Calditrichota bacterium]MCB9368876.1 TonB-dependent receptor [Calditrichota bacterium]
MGKLVQVILLIFGMTAVALGNTTVSGKIKDQSTGESIPSVAVVVEGTNRGAAANVEGFFSIPNLEPGDYTLVFNSLGYEQLRKPIKVKEGQNQNIDVRMQDAAIQFKAVEILGMRDKEPEFAPKVAQIEVTPKELMKLPQLAEPDLMRALQATAGVLPSSDFSAELNIWGGSGDQNLILLNGINVYKPTHLGGLFSIFNMDAVKDVKLIKGGFGAQYGGRLSAVVDVADREGNRNKVEGKVGLSLLSSTAMLEGPMPQGSWLVAGRRTYIDAATKAFKSAGIIEDEFPYYFYDFNAKINRDFANGDRISPSVYWGDDILQLSSATDDRLRLTWGNRTFSVPFVHIFSPKLYSHSTFAGSKYYGNQRFETGQDWFEWRNYINDLTAESDFTYYANARNTLQFGVEGKFFSSALEANTNDFLFGKNTYSGELYSLYATDDYRFTEDWTFSPGLRYEYYGVTDESEVSPRLAARRDLGPGAYVSGAWGLYTQYLQQMRLGEDASLFDSYVPLSDRFGIARGQHYALTFVDDSLGRFKLSGGAYYKKFQNLVQLDLVDVMDDGDTDLEDYVRVGKGYAYGFDLSIGGNFGAYEMSWGYGWGRSRRIFGAFADFEAIDDGLSFPAFFDRQHNTNLFVSRKIRQRGSLEMRMNYSSGLPYTKPTGAYSPGLGLPAHFFQQGWKFGERFDAYVRVDVAYRLKYHWNWCTFSPYFEIINVFNRKNPLFLTTDFSTNPVGLNIGGQLPFLPSLGFTAEF